MATLNLFIDDGLSDADKSRMTYFTEQSRAEVKNFMVALLKDFSALGTTFDFEVGWSMTQEVLRKPGLVLVYVRASVSDTLTKSFAGAPSPPANAAGWTVAVNNVTLSKCYVEQNWPADKFARIILHEAMHNKLRMGNEMHAKAGAGIASDPIQGWEKVTPTNAKLFSAAVAVDVPQWRKPAP